jgi:hypothetical protein
VTEEAEPYDIPIRIDRPLVDGALLANSLLKRMTSAERLKFQAMIQNPTICKGDAKSTMALLASVGLMFVSAMEDARKIHAAREAAGEPMKTMDTVREPKK